MNAVLKKKTTAICKYMVKEQKMVSTLDHKIWELQHKINKNRMQTIKPKNNDIKNKLISKPAISTPTVSISPSIHTIDLTETISNDDDDDDDDTKIVNDDKSNLDDKNGSNITKSLSSL
eukprot:278593_1